MQHRNIEEFKEAIHSSWIRRLCVLRFRKSAKQIEWVVPENVFLRIVLWKSIATCIQMELQFNFHIGKAFGSTFHLSRIINYLSKNILNDILRFNP